ncbi:nucleotidyltransferase domain-containing protein [Baekduia sp. Peel2402]|uniref:nucleotidyltransferase domain-containing protein n=1 Tax=Baekduia sp. Peel2402 TaxID=3458296 RepID=UPI00403E580F
MQLQLLALLLLQPGREWTLQELAEAVGAPVSSVHRELDRAIAMGIVERDDTSRPHLYEAAVESPLTSPVTRMLALTVGVEPRLREALADLPIDLALLHGSWVTGPLRPSSDIDLLVVGKVDLQTLRRRTRPIAKQAGRRIDIALFTSEEFRKMARERASFARHLTEDETTLLVGDLSTIAER